jgi:hypothetical protein
MDKLSSLFVRRECNDEKSFITLTLGVNDIKLFFFSLMLKTNKVVLVHNINIGKNFNGQTF